MNNYIYCQSHALQPNICDDIITLFNTSADTYEGVMRRGLDKSVKDTRDLIIPKDAGSPWDPVNIALYKSLYANLLIYLKHIHPDPGGSYRMFSTHRLSDDFFMIQKYQKNKGKYIYHNDARFDADKYRVITFLWYLNDVEEGGETEFWGKHRIKPEKGKLVLFPASWTFPHTGKMPISSDKYIVTGWLYIDRDPSDSVPPSEFVKDAITDSDGH